MSGARGVAHRDSIVMTAVVLWCELTSQRNSEDVEDPQLEHRLAGVGPVADPKGDPAGRTETATTQAPRHSLLPPPSSSPYPFYLPNFSTSPRPNFSTPPRPFSLHS